MTRDEIKYLLEKVGFGFSKHIGTTYPAGELENILYRFAALVAAHEREVCAELMEQQHTWISNVAASAAIRARGQE
jgi:hypothetical protein